MEDLEAVLNSLKGMMTDGPVDRLGDRVGVLRRILAKEGVLDHDPRDEDPDTSPLPSPSFRSGRKRSSVGFHVHRHAPFKEEVTLDARQFVHFQRLCKHGHWHGTAHPPHLCNVCVGNCGGGFWTRAKVRDRKGSLVSNEKKRISSLLKQAMHIALHKYRRGNAYVNFKPGTDEPMKVEKITYDVPQDKWKTTPMEVQIESESFAKGAMRECWRMIEVETKSRSVAKRYLDAKHEPENPDDPNSVYRVDTKMQAVAKYYAEEFSKHPECWDTVDFIEAYMIKRPDGKIMSIEHYLDGKYVKHNNNSGYCYGSKTTPQAFSHYTWAKSNGDLMIVDIQGVGELYTDPQIHTRDGEDYGEGNLGPAGMAMFFHSHVCNHICETFKLKPLELHHEVAGTEKTSFDAFKAVLPTSRLLNGGLASSTGARHAVDSKTGEQHMVLADLHARGRLTEGIIQYESAFHHLQMAAMYENIPALLCLARMYSGFDRDFLPELTDVPDDHDLTIILLQKAFSFGNREACCALASLCHDSMYTPRDSQLVVDCLRAYPTTSNAKKDYLWSNFDLTPLTHAASLAMVLADDPKCFQESADLYNEAAELAMASGKGNVATKYFMKAEEMQGLADEAEGSEEVETEG